MEICPQLPVNRRIRIPSDEKEGMAGVLLEDLIKANLDRLFTGYDVVCAHAYRVTRNADMTLDEDDSDDLLEEIQSKLKQRQWGEVIRFEYEDSMDPKLLKILRREFEVNESEMYPISGPLDLTYLMKMYSLPGSSRLKDQPSWFFISFFRKIRTAFLTFGSDWIASSTSAIFSDRSIPPTPNLSQSSEIHSFSETA